MAELPFTNLFWLSFFEMFLVSFAGPSCSPLPFIRVPLKSKPLPTTMYHYYVGGISLGTPPQVFNVIIDPGTAELAIRSPSTLTSSLVFPVYDSKKSTTYQKNMTLANVTNTMSAYMEYAFALETLQFGKGFLSTDTLKIGNATIKQQTFIEMTKLGSQMQSMIGSFTDGVLGLAYPSASTSGAIPFFQNMLQQGIIKNPIFALTYSKISSDFELTLGGMDSAKFRGFPTWAPITEKRFWEFSVSGLVVRYSDCNITRLSCKGPMGCQMVVDMNRDGIYGPYEFLSRIGSLIGATSYTQFQGIDCITYNSNTLPDIGFTIGGNDVFLTPAHYMMIGGYSYYTANSTKVDYVYSYFNGWNPTDLKNGNSEVWILGTAFLRAVSTVFDFGNNRIGFTHN